MYNSFLRTMFKIIMVEYNKKRSIQSQSLQLLSFFRCSLVILHIIMIYIIFSVNCIELGTKLSNFHGDQRFFS